MQRKVPKKSMATDPFLRSMAKDNSLQHQSYNKSVCLSSTKQQIGELLILLQTSLNHHQREIYLQVIEVKLRRYLDLKFYGEHYEY